MKTALVFSNGKRVLVTAEEVKNGKYPPSEFEFVDPEYEFKVQFVRGAKNNGGPYFRFYYSYEEFKKLFPDKADLYKTILQQSSLQESLWHKKWKEAFKPFCEIEKTVYNRKIGKYKIADAFYGRYGICIEFQHSYIALDFEERNKFYGDLGIPVIWLFDLPKAAVHHNESGYVEILEDNTKGFFRISEKADNLLKYPVYIQVKSGMIYRVEELQRLETKSEKKSTIRVFNPTEVYTPEEFIDAVYSNKWKQTIIHPFLMPLHKLWRNNYTSMYVLDVVKNEIIMVNRDHKGEIFRKDHGCIIYRYVNPDTKTPKDGEYYLSHADENALRWRFISCHKGRSLQKRPQLFTRSRLPV
ncbi:MAG: hypothetical protein K6D98_06530 [Clostridiales bacterium]|nr:hypothetical protein [Clostridiales bacterium]